MRRRGAALNVPASLEEADADDGAEDDEQAAHDVRGARPATVKYFA